MKLSKFKKNNFKKITKLSLLATVMVLLTWSTPNFCPLTFGQGSSLKALARTSENIAKTIAAVEATGVGDKDPGIKVLIKHYGSGATKAALLEKLREIQAAMPAGGTATATDERLTADLQAARTAEAAVVTAVAAARAAEARVAADEQEALAASAAVSSGAERTAGQLTFGQGSSLKALPRTSENIAKTIAVVAAAAGDKDPGVKVLAKYYGTGNTKAALLAKLQEIQAEMPAAAPAQIAQAVASAGAGGEAVSVSGAAAAESTAGTSWRVPAIIKNWWSSSSEPTAVAGAGAAESKQVQSWGAWSKDILAGITVRHRELIDRELIDKKRTSTLSDDEIAELKELEEARSAKINAMARRL